ncbi:class I SAM-dependent methyltransferase [Streptomyces sp. NPDC014872]|uniref:class I SAM-dependent methyltransferase n=1 Tax=Streptomyces sp. NPDC014872 TaxID=3364926 RepID=UPI0036FF8EB5
MAPVGQTGRPGVDGECLTPSGSLVETALAAPEADVRLAALPCLPFADDEFDAVVGNFVLNHVGRPREALRELRRVTRPGGRPADLRGSAVDSGRFPRSAGVAPFRAEAPGPFRAGGVGGMATLTYGGGLPPGRMREKVPGMRPGAPSGVGPRRRDRGWIRWN